jgi:hypothetical protein
MTLVQQQMNFNFKKGVAGVLMTLSFVPALALAEDNGQGSQNNENTPKVEVSKKGLSNFCAKISSVETKVADQITKAEEKQARNEATKRDKVNKKQGDADEKRAIGRANVDGKRVKNWDKMENKATTDAQKAAVEAYKKSITDAVTARRTAVDAAVKAYRDGLTSAMTTNNTTLNAAVATFKTSVNAALTQAQADCTAKVDSKTVKKAFDQKVKDAKKILKDAKAASNLSSGLTALKKTRDEAIAAAELAFKQATDKAHADLVLALKA